MVKLIDLINESKQVGTLYHFIPFNTLIRVLENNCLKSKFASGQEKTFDPKEYYVSFTRNKNFDQVAKIFNLRVGINYNPEYVGCVCRLTIDGNKLSNKYHIEPVRDTSFSSTDSKSKWSQTPKVIKKGKKYFSADESEERVYTNQCIPINNYITEITLINPSDKEIEIIKSIPEYTNLLHVISK